MVIYDALPSLGTASRAELTTGAVLDRVELKGADLSGLRAANLSLMDVAVRTCSANEVSTAGIRSVGTYMGDVMVQTWRALDGAWRDATFERLRVGAWLADGTELVDVQISASKLDLLSLRGSHITRLSLTHCTVETLDLTGAEVVDLEITGGTVGELLTHDAHMRNLDVSGTELRMVSRPGHLRGLVISQAQLRDLAPAFAAHMGVVVNED